MNLLVICLAIPLAIFVRLSSADIKRRIVGGNQIDIKDAPYQVLLIVSKHPFCGGALISETFVLTAGHCVDDYLPDHLTVRVGSTFNDKGGKLIKVVDIIEHPKYSFVSYDFAILQLDDEESLPSVAKPIKLPEETDIAKTGQMMMVSGWGQTLNALESFDILRAVDVPIVSTRKCKSWYGTQNPITDQMICAGFRKGGHDSCQGDSGGPMKRKSDGVLIGIVSWGIDCAKPYSPGVYAKVSSVRPWIRNITKI